MQHSSLSGLSATSMSSKRDSKDLKQATLDDATLSVPQQIKVPTLHNPASLVGAGGHGWTISGTSMINA